MSLRAQLQAVYDQHGKLTPELVVATAKPKDHPLHTRFEWDNRIAGQRYREIQAAELIRSINVVWTKSEEPSGVRYWHAVREEHRFEPIDKIMTDDISRHALLRQVERDWKAMHRRYKHLEEFLEMVRRDVA